MKDGKPHLRLSGLREKSITKCQEGEKNIGVFQFF